MSLLSQIVDEITAVTRPAAGEPAGALVLIHGRGSDEHDLVPLLDAFDPGRRLVGITPRGPLTLPPGGRHWYAFRALGYPDPDTFLPTYAAAGAWLDGLAPRPACRSSAPWWAASRRARDVVGAGAGRRPAAAGRDHRAVGVHAHRGGIRARPVRAGRLPGGDRPRQPGQRDRRRVGEAGARPHARGRRRRALPRVAAAAHGRPRVRAVLASGWEASSDATRAPT